MLEYRVNTKKFDKTKVELNIENISFVDLTNLVDEENEILEYDGFNKDKIMLICECKDIDKVNNGDFVKTENTLYLDYGVEQVPEITEYNFIKDYQISGVNKNNKSFSIYIDKYFTLNQDKIEKIIYNDTLGVEEGQNIFLHFNDYHYFDVNDKEIPIYFNTIDENGELTVKTILFGYYSQKVLVGSIVNFQNADADFLFKNIFGIDDIADNVDDFNEKYIEGDLSGIEIYRDNFLFGEKTNYTFSFERPIVNINVPIVNTFETNLTQMELLNEYFVETEKKKAINRITDIEKDVYYPCIPNNNSFGDVYTIKFNLHFREHRGDDWLVENESFWNCIEQSDGRAKIINTTQNKQNKQMTTDNRSDLLSFLGFTNEDVRFQKNKLKKSFLRLMYFDSTNPANQNMIGYSTIFFDTGDMFAKYIKYNEEKNYVAVNMNENQYGVYNISKGKTGIRVNRESFNENTRLSSQFVVKSKNTSKASSEGFYLYIWKDNSTPLPQDLYMKVEFNHAGYGRTIPFMMPYWDKKKYKRKDTVVRKKEIGIKTFEEILDDWNAKEIHRLKEKPSNIISNDNFNALPPQQKEQYYTDWSDYTDGHYGIRQYTKFSYIHLKYRYDKETDKHIYYLDPDTYGNIKYPTGDDGNKYIEINLYEAKVE